MGIVFDNLFNIICLLSHMKIISILITINKNPLFYEKFSVAKATLQSLMSVHPSVRLSVLKTPKQFEIIILHPSSFIILHSSFIHHSSFFIHSSFISQLLSFSACLNKIVFKSQCCSCK